MTETKNLNDLVLVDKKKLVQMLDDLKCNVKARRIEWYRCNICTLLYMRTELTVTNFMGLICLNCKKSMKDLDDEQKEAETMMREEKKSKCF